MIFAVSLRLVNQHEVPVDAVLRCGDATRTVSVGPRGIVDVPDAEGCTAADGLLPLLALRLEDEWQVEERQSCASSEPEREDCLSSTCGSPAMAVPQFACRNGTASAYAEPLDGATYEWIVEGATIISGAGTHRVTVQLTDPTLVTLRVERSTASCTGGATGVIHVREPIVVRELTVPQTAGTDQPVTLRWSYEPGREPNAQLLTGDLFPRPVALGPAQRSYTFTPKSSGTRTVELRASYAQTIAVSPPRRRRAASGATTSATECPAARASATMNVSGCTDEVAFIDAPDDILAGATFHASVRITGDQKAEWSVENGTLKSVSPFTDTAEIIAGAGGRLRITARIQQKPGCFITAETEVPILLSAEQCPVPPTATLSLAARGCDRAQVVARFTGTPPFSGRWSDGTEFQISGPATHDFTNPGTYGITEFRDAACYGRVGEPVTVATFRPSVRLELLSNDCGIARMAAHFTGVPPFKAVWSDWEPIETSEPRVERTMRIPGGFRYDREVRIHNVSDAVCEWGLASNALEPHPVAQAGITSEPHCQTDPAQGALVYVSGNRGNALGYHGPIAAEWADGTVSWSSTNVATRTLPPITTPSASFELKNVIFAGCPAELTGNMAHVINRPTAMIATDLPVQGCAGQPLTAKLSRQPVPGAMLRWSLRGDYAMAASAVDGPEFAFTSRRGGNVYVSVATEHLDRKCNGKSNEVVVWFRDPADVLNVKLDPEVIPRGGSTRITWERAGDFSVGPSLSVPPERASGLSVESWGAAFVDRNGPGSVPITFSWSDCRGSHTKTVTLTITP